MPPQRHYDTPRRAKVQGAYEFASAQAIPFDPRDIFKQFGVSNEVGYRLIKPDAPSRRNHSRPGRPYKVTPEQVREADQVLEDETLELEGKRLTWDQLATEVEADVVGRTMKNIMNAALDYEKCLVCVKGWLKEAPMDKRLEWAVIMLDKYPREEQWDRVRFSDEVHFGRGPEGKLRIIRKPGTRYRWDCIQHKDPPAAKDEKRVHCWAAIGYNFKSELVFYNVPGNSNGKMTHRTYIDSILDPVIKPWLDRGDDFVLEEDGDSGHGTGRTRNPVRKWKEDHGLEHYFNCSQSPDLAPVENCWQPTKQHIRKYPHWDDDSLIQLIKEGWENVTQDFINERCRSMSQRLKDVIASKGAMTGW